MASPHDENRPSRRSKSADAFRTISEVSDDVGVPQHVLRFWETKFSQIKPLKRGGGRRYYRPEDVDLLNQIRAWLYDDGYTIKGVQKLLKDGAMPSPAASGSPSSSRSGGSSPEDSDAGADQEAAARASDAPARTAGDVESEKAESDGVESDRAESSKDAARETPVLRPRDVDDDDDRPSEPQRQSDPAERTVAMDSGDDFSDQVRGTDTERERRVAAEKADPTRVSVDDLVDDVPLQEGAPPDFGAWERASLDSVIESLEEIRDRLRGPPPEP